MSSTVKTTEAKRIEAYIENMLAFSDVSEKHSRLQVSVSDEPTGVEIDFENANNEDNTVMLTVSIEHDKMSTDVRPYVDTFSFKVIDLNASREKIGQIVQVLRENDLPEDRVIVSGILSTMELAHMKETLSTIVVIQQQGQVVDVLTDSYAPVRVVEVGESVEEDGRLSMLFDGSIDASTQEPTFKAMVDAIDLESLHEQGEETIDVTHLVRGDK